MNGVLIIPTGIEAEIGGHAGDANPVAKMIASVCDKLIIHPNVVNASDINEMPENCLYVEGSILDRFLEGDISLKEVRAQNKILLVVNAPVREDTINAVSAARVTIGVNIEILELKEPLRMISKIEDGVATGDVLGWEKLIKQVNNYEFDALAIQTPIEVKREVILNYYKNGGVNPWGGVEAKASKLIANGLDKPVAHAPLESVKSSDEELFYIYNQIVDPRIAPEVLSICYLHCVLKGLNRAPRIGQAKEGLYVNGLYVNDIDFMVSPYGCIGPPHHACIKNNVPVIIVKENKTILKQYDYPKEFIIVENYWEAMGIITAMKAGVLPSSVRRPINQTTVIKKYEGK